MCLKRKKQPAPDRLFHPQQRSLEMQLFTSGLKGRISREDCLLLIVHTSFIAGLPASNKLFNKRRGGEASRNCRRGCGGERVGAASPEVAPRGLSPRRQSTPSSRRGREEQPVSQPGEETCHHAVCLPGTPKSTWPQRPAGIFTVPAAVSSLLL